MVFISVMVRELVTSGDCLELFRHYLAWRSWQRGSCAICPGGQEEEKAQVCAACKNIRYCSPECQTSDWPAHKIHCGKKTPRRLYEEAIKKIKGITIADIVEIIRKLISEL